MDWQELTVLAVVALSAFFVVRRFWRSYKGKDTGCGCGGSCACSAQKEKQNSDCGSCSQAAQREHIAQHLEKA